MWRHGFLQKPPESRMKQEQIAKTVTLCNMRGLHARAAGRLIKLASAFQADVFIKYRDQIAEADSIMDLMILGAGIGSKVEIVCRGKEAQAALEAITNLIENKFNEAT